jgi:hypothetical protein
MVLHRVQALRSLSRQGRGREYSACKLGICILTFPHSTSSFSAMDAIADGTATVLIRMCISATLLLTILDH